MNPWDTLKPEQIGKVWEHPAEVETDADIAWLKQQVEAGNIVSDRDLGDETDAS